jgi:hypothetical protein
MRLQVSVLFVGAAFVALIGASISAQTQGQGQGQAQGQGQVQGQPPPQGRGGGRPPQNLQVLPKDMTGQQVQMFMRTFTAALGVECTHCHVQDRSSDEKPTKVTARKMLQMVAAINGDLLKGIGEPPAAGTQKVTCFTCHRGALKPLTAPPPGGGGF